MHVNETHFTLPSHVDRLVLTERQRQCLQWVREGKSSTDIADILGISSGVVDEHLAGACRRLGVRTRTQAVIEAMVNSCLD